MTDHGATLRQKRSIRALLAILILVSLAWGLYQLPLNRVIERRLCRDFYRAHDPSVVDGDGNVPETRCKVQPVQEDLGRYQGMMETAWLVGDFAVTIPIVSLVEHYGRRPVLLVNMFVRIFVLAWPIVLGYFDELLPTTSFLAAPFLSVLGGDCVFNSVLYALASDLTDDPVTRATYFSQMNAISSIFTFQLGPALSSASMSIALWLPFCIGIMLLLLAVPLISVLPTGLSTKASSFDGEEEESLLSSPVLKAQTRPFTVLDSIKNRAHKMRDMLASHPRNFSLLLCCFFLSALASSDTKIMAQYISQRYGWTFASVGYLLSAKAVFNFFYLTIVLPGMLRLHAATTASLNQDQANVHRVHICLGLSAVGALAIALAPTVALLVPALLLYALGIALPIFMYSLLRSPAVSPDRLPAGTVDRVAGADSHIFSIVMPVKALGQLVGAPVMATLWVHGIGLAGMGLGLPFFVSAVIYAAAMVVFAAIKVP